MDITNHSRLTPISWSPSQFWDGIDGQWSSFGLRIGNAEQAVRVLPSTSGHTTCVVLSDACPPYPPTCSELRGGLVSLNKSASWHDLGTYTLVLDQNLETNATGKYGLDSLTLGLIDEAENPKVDSQIIAGIMTNRYYNGLVGLTDQPVGLSNFSHPYPSFLTSLKTAGMIPSLSWAYTAGAHYRLKGVFGSLTFGGMDRARYIPNDVSFNLASDVGRDLVVGLQSIKATYPNGSSYAFLPSPILTFIDSTHPFIYLPAEACQVFENELGLEWDQTKNLYLIDSKQRQQLLDSNPEFAFSLGNEKATTPRVDIRLPYASFDLSFSPPAFPNTTYYFPLRRATNESQFTLGRAFLQEAYVITDYERKNFSVAQSRFEERLDKEIIAIPSNATVAHSERHQISKGGVVGICIGIVAFIVLLSLILSILIRRSLGRRPKRNRDEPKAPKPQPNNSRVSSVSTQEMANGSLWNDHQELCDNGKFELQNEHITELPLRITPAPSEPFASTVPTDLLVAQHRHLMQRYAVSSARSNRGTISDRHSETKSSSRSIESLARGKGSIVHLNLNKILPPIPMAMTEAAKLHAPFSSPRSHDRAIIASIATTRSSTSLAENDSPWGKQTATSSPASTIISESFQVSTVAIGHLIARPRSLQRPLSKLRRSVRPESPYATRFDYDIYMEETISQDGK